MFDEKGSWLLNKNILLNASKYLDKVFLLMDELSFSIMSFKILWLETVVDSFLASDFKISFALYSL